uniref:Exocyst complex subunit EXOC6/Sec15 C-terminal domain-containing protein n=1 Tax=Meleagris gallopavo TaxID=9103 RepID=A0A803Y0C8_MELGA
LISILTREEFAFALVLSGAGEPFCTSLLFFSAREVKNHQWKSWNLVMVPMEMGSRWWCKFDAQVLLTGQVIPPKEMEHLTTLSGKNFPLTSNLNLPSFNFKPFPLVLPFQRVERMYYTLQISLEILLSSSTEVDDMIRKSTNLLLTRTLSNCLQNVIKRKNVGLTELVQIIINTTHLEKSCKFLEEFITNITNVLPETVHTTKLYGTTTFKDARHAAEEEIYTNLNQKIDQFLQLADYDWMALEPGSRASDYLVDLIGFLRSTFAVFTHLPGKVAQTACMSACKHLSTSLMQLLLEAEVRQLTLGALQQFNLDVEECERPEPGQCCEWCQVVGTGRARCCCLGGHLGISSAQKQLSKFEEIKALLFLFFLKCFTDAFQIIPAF